MISTDPVAPIRPVGPTYLHPPPQPVYATQASQRPPMQFHHQYRAPPPPRPVRQFTQLGMPLEPSFSEIRQIFTVLTIREQGHDADSCSALRHAIQDLIDQGLVDLGRPGDEIFMMGWDGEAPQSISLYEESDFVGYIPRQQIPRPFSLTPNRNLWAASSITNSYTAWKGSTTSTPLTGHLLTHRDALVRALGQIRVDTATTPEGLIHMLTADRATCIVFSDDDLPPEGSNHVRPLFIDVACLGRRVPSVLLDNGSALNVCPLVTAIALGFSPDDFGPSTQTVRAYDGTQRTVMGTLSTHVMIGPVSYSIVFQVLRIQSSFNLLLGRPWIHEAGAIPSSLHQKVKFIHEGRIITIQSDRDIITSSEPVLHISHSEDDLHLTGFTFDEVQVVSLEDGSRDMVPMSFDQHSSTLVLSMMRGMSYLPGYIPTEADARYMSQLRRDRVRARMSGIPFDYPLRPYTFQLADYFIRGSEHTPRTEGTVHIPETVEIQDIQQALGQIHLDTGTTEAPGAMIVTPPSPDRASMFSMCFPEEVPDYDLPMDLGYGTDEMDMIGIGVSSMQRHTGPILFSTCIGRILDAAPRGPLSAFDISGVSVLDDESVLDVVTSDFASVEGASDSVDPPLSFDTMSGFVTRFDDISDGNNDMSIFEYLNVSQHFPLIAPPAPTTHIYDVDDVGDTDDPLGGQSECDSDTEDRKVTPISSSTELIDFGAPDQPREIRIGSSLSPDERSRLIDLLRSYLDVFAWSYEDMPGLDPTIVQHHLPILPHARPVKQKLRRLHPRWSLQVKEEIQKQLSVGFLSVVEYPEWLANVVPVPKKDGKVRVCVDFRDLNKASPKDDFPLPHIDMLVDSTAGHPMLSFMDGFSGYNQILMAPEDMVKTSFITEWGTYCYRVMPFGLKNAGATYQRAATTLFHDMMHRDVETVQAEIESQEVHLWGDFWKIAGHIVSERGIEVDPEKIRAILDMPTPRTEKEIRGFLGRLQYISRFIARLTDICEPIFRLLRKNQPTVWNDDFSDMALGCMLAQLDDLGKEIGSSRWGCNYGDACFPNRPVLTGRLMRWLVLLTEFDIHYVMQKSVKGSIVADHLASLPISDDRSVDDDFPDEQIVSMTSITGWRLYFDGAANQSEYEACITGLETALDLGIRQLEIHGDSNLVIKADSGAENQFADALATLASLIVIPAGVNVRPLLMRLDRASADQVMREVHVGVCGPHMGGHMLARKIMRTGYFWLTIETDCCQFVQRCQECQMHGDLIHVPPSELHALASPWPFSVWGIDIIGKISPKSSSGHEYILVAIDYFTKWVEAASYARLTAARVAKFIRSHIICRYGVPHELISDRGVHFKGEVDTLIQEYGIQHHRSSAYRPQTNGAKLPFALWAYRTSFRTSIGATPYSLMYGMEAVLPVEIEMRSLRVALEQHISEAEWAQSRYDQLSLKRVKPRKFQRGDLVLKVLRGLISDPRGKFRPSWSEPYVIRDLTREGAAWLTDLDGNQFKEPAWCHSSLFFLASLPVSFRLHFASSHRLPVSPVSISSIHFASVFPCVMMMRSRPELPVRVESPCSHGSMIFDIAHTEVSITSGDIEGHILSFHSVYLPQGMLPSLHAGFGSLYMYAGIPFRLAMLWTSKFEFTVFIEPAGVHTPFIVLFVSSNEWVFSDVFQSFIKIFEFQMYTLGHIAYQFLWILDVVD
ncbi:Transposon Ty3-I Gag-Pol polyprotein [Vitis vinifera]|uniref:Transposon Ty3-I Gag-Pol polyprotein n=1 Tax=Vitis vinifera TaxID=29760 RepID=A0A438FSR8_VITVI|nr:Transposon Ty3-I Gag-Pol polyprotein [Vitis vinifera]